MKCLKFLFITLFTFTTMASFAQEKPAEVQIAKNKSANSEKAFKIIEKGSMLTKANFRRDLKAAGNVIEIEALNVSGGSISGMGTAVLPAADISNIQSINGNYLSTRNVSKSGRGVVMQLVDVTYPYRARLTVSDQVLEFEINEPGFWKISLAVSQ